MRTVWQVFLRDCRRILRNPVAVVVTLGVAMLPSLYAWFNILANWDPYSATGNLQVAVANEDQGTTNDLVGHLDAGRQVVKKLKQNDELGWRFVDNEEQAVHGVETGGYYAAIVLPKDFSTSLVESVTGTSKQPKIKYYVNEKKNAIAPKITDTGATTIDEQINSAFVTTVATTVASAVSEAGGDLDQATGKVQHDTINDLNTVMSTLNTVQDSLTDLQDTLAQSDTILADAKQTTASLKQTVAAAQKASRQSGNTGRVTSLLHHTGRRTRHQFSTTLRTGRSRQQRRRQHHRLLQQRAELRRHHHQHTFGPTECHPNVNQRSERRADQSRHRQRHHRPSRPEHLETNRCARLIDQQTADTAQHLPYRHHTVHQLR